MTKHDLPASPGNGSRETHFCRTVIGGVVLLALLMARPPLMAEAQDGILIPAEQTVIALYGDSLTFNVRAVASSIITGARLTVQILNHPDQTIESVPVEPGTTVTVSHTIPVGTLHLPPVATLTYHWDFQDAAGSQFRSEAATYQYENNATPWEWSVERVGNITVHTDGRDPAVSQAALQVATQASSQASRIVGVAVDAEMIHIYVYPDLASMAYSLRLHQLQVHDWVAAYAVPDQSAIILAAEPGPEMVANLQRDLLHEMIHLAVFAAAWDRAGNVPGWFNEGLALMTAPEPDLTLRDVLYEASRGGVVLSLDTLCVPSFTNMSPHDAALAYAQSESLMRYITERYGTSQVTALMNAYADGLGCSAGVERALGIPLADLERQWQADLSERLARTPRSNTSLVPWLVVWLVSISLALLFIAPQPSRQDERPLFDTRVALKPISQEEATNQTGE